jgi:hypothetical protein
MSFWGGIATYIGNANWRGSGSVGHGVVVWCVTGVGGSVGLQLCY